MLVYTCLFTIAGADPSKNKYVDMLYIWLHMLKTYGGLTAHDHVFVFIDEVTIEFIHKKYLFLGAIFKSLVCQFNIIKVPQPSTYFEGMLMKYMPFRDPWKSKFMDASHCIYLDLDVLPISRFQRFIDEFDMVHPDVLYVCAEGPLTDDNYLGKFATSEELAIIHCKDVKLYGVTAGIFGFTPGPAIEIFMNRMLYLLANASDKKMYTLDQPYFNREVIYGISTNTLRISYKTFANHVYINKHITPNGTFVIPNDSIILWNNMGEPMAPDVHLSKVIMAMSIMHARDAAAPKK